MPSRCFLTSEFPSDYNFQKTLAGFISGKKFADVNQVIFLERYCTSAHERRKLGLYAKQQNVIATNISSIVSPLYSLSSSNDNSWANSYFSSCPCGQSPVSSHNLSQGTSVKLDNSGSGEVYLCVRTLYFLSVVNHEHKLRSNNLKWGNVMLEQWSRVTWLVERMNWLLAKYVSSQKISGFSMLSSFEIFRSPRRWLSIAIPVIAWKIFFRLSANEVFSIRTSI